MTETLSDKIIYGRKGSLSDLAFHLGVIETKDVKKAVKKLKEEFTLFNKEFQWTTEKIDKIFGDKLT